MKKFIGNIGPQRIELNFHNSNESNEVRREVATQLLSGMMVNCALDKEVAVSRAIAYADELLKQLKENQ